MNMKQIRIYYECLEQAENYIKPIIEKVKKIKNTPLPLKAPTKVPRVLEKVKEQALKQYSYYNTEERHKRLKLYTITSDEREEKDISAVIRKAIDEFLDKRNA